MTQERKFTVRNKSGEELVCVEVTPRDPTTKLPTVILCHGFGYFKEEDGIFTELAKRLADLDYAVYYFDFSGCGESEGDYSTTTLTKLIQDLDSVINAVSAYDYVDAENLSLVSHSFGSSVLIGAQIPNLQRMVLSGSFYNPFEIISGIFPDFNENGISTRHATSERTRKMGPQFWKDLKTYDLNQLIHNFECPILFIHGKQDGIVPIKNMYPLIENSKRPAGPIVLEQSDHDLKPERETAFSAITEFFT